MQDIMSAIYLKMANGFSSMIAKLPCPKKYHAILLTYMCLNPFDYPVFLYYLFIRSSLNISYSTASLLSIKGPTILGKYLRIIRVESYSTLLLGYPPATIQSCFLENESAGPSE